MKGTKAMLLISSIMVLSSSAVLACPMIIKLEKMNLPGLNTAAIKIEGKDITIGDFDNILDKSAPLNQNYSFSNPIHIVLNYVKSAKQSQQFFVTYDTKIMDDKTTRPNYSIYLAIASMSASYTIDLTYGLEPSEGVEEKELGGQKVQIFSPITDKDPITGGLCK